MAEGRRASAWQYPPKDGIEGCYAAGFDRCQDVQTIERMDGSWEVRCFACGAFYGMGMTPPARETTPTGRYALLDPTPKESHEHAE